MQVVVNIVAHLQTAVLVDARSMAYTQGTASSVVGAEIGDDYLLCFILGEQLQSPSWGLG